MRGGFPNIQDALSGTPGTEIGLLGGGPEFAVAAIQRDTEEVVAMRRGAPLVLGFGEALYIASDPLAFPQEKNLSGFK